MDHFILQKEILNKLNTIVVLSDEINEELSKKLIAKSRAIRVELTNDLK